MSRRVLAREGEVNVVLPDGWALDGGDLVVVADVTWARIAEDPNLLRRVVDAGFTTEVADPVPTWRDIQRVVANSDIGLGAAVDDLQAELGAHEASTTGVHGIADTALLETKAGAQAKADTALGVAEAYTDAHAARTLNVHGIADTAALATKTYVDSHVDTPYRATFNVAVASDTWLAVHGQNTYALHVECFTNSDQRIVGNVQYPDANTVRIDFYTPQSGYVRLWD